MYADVLFTPYGANVLVSLIVWQLSILCCMISCMVSVTLVDVTMYAGVLYIALDILHISVRCYLYQSVVLPFVRQVLPPRADFASAFIFLLYNLACSHAYLHSHQFV